MPDHRDYRGVKLIISRSGLIAHTRRHLEMDSYVATWCPVCDKRVSNKGKDTNGLLAHIRKFHPKRSNQYLLQKEEGPKITTKKTASKITELQSFGNTDSNSKKSETKKVYATRVDTWKSHNEKKICPRCHKEAIPTLHTRGDKLTTSHIGALCLLGCWPLCFVPLIMKRAKKVRMFCPLCGYMYGNFQYKNTGLAPCKTDSEESQTRLSSPPRSFRLCAEKEEQKN
ncbi:Lipopolysaccharide-induced tumor necrosis factor-alpha factor [Apis cerana cerana]|uniref:Lipopolysaccharide-induced tumor necrosis factor-alpha factor n=1 Tax=Apis cerana cerana TaxID=94128 RepID=A0A2A3E7J0_APICC|nr:Lipopolysaccharide-induced tumor necrosis factor-alpha factor [Apis cerana cerana]